jgi:hypothetical protein
MLFAVLKLSCEIFTPSPMRQRGEGQERFCSYKNTSCHQIRPFQETGFITTNQNPYLKKKSQIKLRKDCSLDYIRFKQ